MSNLVQFLHSLATDPKQLIAFKTNPHSVDAFRKLSTHEQNAVFNLVNQLVSYEKYHLYVDDDKGGIIYMVYTQVSDDNAEEQALHGVLSRDKAEIHAIGVGRALHFQSDSSHDDAFYVNVDLKITRTDGDFPDQRPSTSG